MVLTTVDPPEVHLGWNETWHLPFRWASDPAGERIAKPLDSWNAEAAIFKPIVLLVDPDGRQVYRHDSLDFADRPDDEDVLGALASLGLSAVPEPQGWAPEGVTPRPSERAFPPPHYAPYFRSLRFASLALAERMTCEPDREELHRTHRMADSFLLAWPERRKRLGLP